MAKTRAEQIESVKAKISQLEHEKMSELRKRVSERREKAGSIKRKLEALNILKAAEKIVRELNRPQQQRDARNRGKERQEKLSAYKVTTNSTHFPCSPIILIFPLCASTMAFAIESPSPYPPVSRARESSLR